MDCVSASDKCDDKSHLYSERRTTAEYPNHRQSAFQNENLIRAGSVTWKTDLSADVAWVTLKPSICYRSPALRKKAHRRTNEEIANFANITRGREKKISTPDLLPFFPLDPISHSRRCFISPHFFSSTFANPKQQVYHRRLYFSQTSYFFPRLSVYYATRAKR